jgi:hypothetical protein
MIERREKERFKVGNNAYVYSASSFTFVGKIIDVSRSGIAFSYVEDYESVPAKIDELGILVSYFGYITENLPFEIVSNEVIPCPPGSTVVMRRCGGRFLFLTPEQEGELERFIARHAKKDSFECL